MEKSIDFEAEVKRVYPDAFIHAVSNGYCILSVQKAEETNNIVVAESWRAAYNTLKQQGKL